MKLFVFVSLGLAILANAQNINGLASKPEATASVSIPTTTTAIPEPEWPGQPYAIVDGKLLSLESQRRNETTKVKLLGFAGGMGGYVFPGATSPTKTSAGPEFLIKVDITGEPSTLVGLNRLTVDTKKGVRVIVIAKVGIMAMSSKELNENEVPLHFERYGNSLRFSPASPLSPREYMITTKSIVAYLFHVE